MKNQINENEIRKGIGNEIHSEIDKKIEKEINNEIETNKQNETKNKKQMKVIKIIIGVLVISIIIGAFIYLTPIMKSLATTEGRLEFKDKIQNTGFAGMLLLFGLQIAQVFLFILPGEPIEILSGMCYGGLGGTLFVLISTAIISIGIFYLVRKLGQKFVYEFCDKEKVKKIENSKMFQDPKRVEIIMFILFLIPGTPKDLFVYIAGLLPIKPLRFIIISTIARIPSIVSSTYAGQKILEGNYKTALIVYGVIIAVVFAFIFIVNKFDKNKVTKEAMKVIK